MWGCPSAAAVAGFMPLAWPVDWLLAPRAAPRPWRQNGPRKLRQMEMECGWIKRLPEMISRKVERFKRKIGGSPDFLG